jgi:hypothetical protein
VTEDPETSGRPGHNLRSRRYAIAGLVLLVVGVGVLVGLLSRTGTREEAERVTPPSPAPTPQVTDEAAVPAQTPVTEVAGSPLPESPAVPVPPTPAEQGTVVGSGTAFGGQWTLSAYIAKEGEDEGSVCYSITGVIEATGCSDPAAGGDSSVHLTGQTYHPYPDRPVVHGVVGKSVAGITLSLDDGRVLTTETLKHKAFPVAFFVVPLKEGSQVAVYETLDAGGEVLDESSYRP